MTTRAEMQRILETRKEYIALSPIRPDAADWERAVNEFLPDMILRRDAIKRRAEELARERVR